MAFGGRVLTREPYRTCAGCRAVDRKAVLVRVAGSPGRGAHVHPRETCVEAARRGGLARSLRRDLEPTERTALAQIASRFDNRPGHLVAGHDPAKAVERLPQPEAKE